MKNSEQQSSEALDSQNWTISFRDPSGSLAVSDNRVLRSVYTDGQGDLEAFLNSTAARQLLTQQDIVSTQQLDISEDNNRALAQHLFGCEPAFLLEHERIPFISYPHEWPPEMLHEAALLTLRLCKILSEENLGIKDATPHNVLFKGPKPIFIDLLSFEKRQSGDPIWLPEAQFARTLILPLLTYKYFQIYPHMHFLVNRDGIKPDDVYAMSGFSKFFIPIFLQWVTLPTWLSKKTATNTSSQQEQKPISNAKSSFILNHLFSRLERTVKRLTPSSIRSSWSEYTTCTHYDKESIEVKERFVKRCLEKQKPKWVLDLGCNTGQYSCIAAENGASVVAVDSDASVAGQVWNLAVKKNLDILPLVLNIASPPPAMGWRNKECHSFLDRIKQRFQTVLMLAFIHHLLVTERIPLDDIVELASSISTETVIVEYVGKEDIMFQHLLRGRGHLFEWFNIQAFETAWEKHFEIVESQEIPHTNRKLYFFAKKK